MKRKSMVLIVGIVLVSILFGCSNLTAQLQSELQDFTNLVEGECPDDLCLTIYYLSPFIFTRKPLSKEELIDFPGTQKICVDSEELEMHFDHLKILNHAVLLPVKEPSFIDARLYYFFEVGESNKVLEIVTRGFNETVFVNGVEVETNPVFYELIEPFLTEDAYNILFNTGDG